MILFDRVNKRYPSGHQAITNLSFELGAGEMAFLTGHSGAGKSTLLKLIMLMERSTSGQLLIDGKNLSRIDRKQIPYYRRNIGVIFQNHQLLFDRNIFDNVELPLLVSVVLDMSSTPRFLDAGVIILLLLLVALPL